MGFNARPGKGLPCGGGAFERKALTAENVMPAACSTLSRVNHIVDYHGLKEAKSEITADHDVEV